MKNNEIKKILKTLERDLRMSKYLFEDPVIKNTILELSNLNLLLTSDLPGHQNKKISESSDPHADLVENILNLKPTILICLSSNSVKSKVKYIFNKYGIAVNFIENLYTTVDVGLNEPNSILILDNKVFTVEYLGYLPKRLDINSIVALNHDSSKPISSFYKYFFDEKFSDLTLLKSISSALLDDTKMFKDIECFVKNNKKIVFDSLVNNQNFYKPRKKRQNQEFSVGKIKSDYVSKVNICIDCCQSKDMKLFIESISLLIDHTKKINFDHGLSILSEVVGLIDQQDCDLILPKLVELRNSYEHFTAIAS